MPDLPDVHISVRELRFKIRTWCDDVTNDASTSSASYQNWVSLREGGRRRGNHCRFDFLFASHALFGTRF